MKRTLISIHILLIILEMIALVHDIQSFGPAMLKYYTIDSNILQMLVSAGIVYWFFSGKEQVIPIWLCVLHLICAVCLTITFLIALLVLAPQEGFAYYFLQDVAPINHFIGPLLSVVTFLFMERSEPLSKRSIFAPMAATLIYGVVTLFLNVLGLLDGPYFFLRVYDETVMTITMWFGIISALCIVLSGMYLGIRRKMRNGSLSH